MQADPSQLYKDVDFLTSILPYRNYLNQESLETAAAYIKSALDATGLSTFVQQWKADGNTYKNIIASYRPERERRLIVGAHYDVYKDQPGADDNASGVAGLLELARLIAKERYHTTYGIDFAAYCLEEPPFFKKKEMGSYVHAKWAHEKGLDIVGMMSLEMIGYYSEEKETDFSSLPGSSESNSKNSKFIVVAGIDQFEPFNDKMVRLMRSAGAMGVKKVTFSATNPNNGPSDHRNYWKFNYPAVMLIAGKEKGNPNYHKKTDTIDTLNFDGLAAAVNSCFHTLLHW